MNDPNQNSNSSSKMVALIRFKVMNFLEDQIRGGQLLAEALRQASARP